MIMSVTSFWISVWGADITSSCLSGTRVISHVPSCLFSPASTCPLSCALWPHDASLSWQAFHSLAQLLGVCTEIPCMCQLLLQQTQNRWLTATCMWVCRTKMCAGEWQDHPAPEVKHKGDETTCIEAVLLLFYGVHKCFTLHYKEHSCLLKVSHAETLACLKQHRLSCTFTPNSVCIIVLPLFSLWYALATNMWLHCFINKLGIRTPVLQSLYDALVLSPPSEGNQKSWGLWVQSWTILLLWCTGMAIALLTAWTREISEW